MSFVRKAQSEAPKSVSAICDAIIAGRWTAEDGVRLLLRETVTAAAVPVALAQPLGKKDDDDRDAVNGMKTGSV